MSDKKTGDSRRRLLKSIAAGSGAVVAGKSMPNSWSKPVIDSVVLPAHAETTDDTGSNPTTTVAPTTTPATPCSGCFDYFIAGSSVRYIQGTYPAGTVEVYMEFPDCSGTPDAVVQAVEADSLAEAQTRYAEAYGAACPGEFENVTEISCANVWMCLGANG